MSKKNNIRTPKFLDLQLAREINNSVYQGTGCFLFLTLPEEKLLSPLPSSNGGDSYWYNVINLYKMYCDYGRYFLWFCIQKSVIPSYDSLEDKNDTEYKENIKILEQDHARVIEHYRFIAKNARHVLSHGIFQQETMLSSYKDPKIVFLENTFLEILKDKKWPENQQDWKKINQWVIEEADFLYDWLKKWGLVWKKCPETEINTLQRKFYYGRWEYAQDKDNCLNTDMEDYTLGKYEENDYHIYDEQNKNITSFARAFPSQLIFDASEYLASSVSNCVRSQYAEHEDYGFWKSDRPNANIKALFMNINFYGIDNVRQKMQDKKEGVLACPDGYRLYLEGLSRKMTTLPKVTSRETKKSHFTRR